jgi:short-subunit dehydrogenase
MSKSQFAMVTGGSSGIGFAIAKELAQKGFGIVLVSNQENELQQCCKEIETQFEVSCIALFKDLTAASAAQEIFDFCQTQELNVQVLVNNAGILVFSEVITAPTEKIHAILQLHIYTSVMLCRFFGEQMKPNKTGYILNVSSISSVMPYPGISLYGPTKTFMRYFTRALRSEMKIHAVKVCCLIPGATATGLYDPNKINLELAMKTGVMHTPEFVAAKAIKAMMNNKAECIPGWLNKLTVALLPLVPIWLIETIHRKTKLMEKGNQSLG